MKIIKIFELNNLIIQKELQALSSKNLSNIMALDKVSSIEAKAKIEPKIGPIQGVQPNPKANPIMYGNKKCFVIFLLQIFFLNLNNQY